MLDSFTAARNVTFKRNPNYWGKNLNVNIGKYNFDEIRYEYFRDQTVLVEALKGDQYDFRAENSAKNWSTAYENLEARKKAFSSWRNFPMKRQASCKPMCRICGVINLKMPASAALSTLLMTLKVQTAQFISIFIYACRVILLAQNSRPQAFQNRKSLNYRPLRGQIPDAVFTEPYTNPVNGDNRKLRDNLREAVRLFKEAGYSIKDGKMVNDATGEPFEFEFLDYSGQGSRAVLPWQKNLERIGVTLNYRR